MNRIHIKTCDIFDNKNKSVRQKYFSFCYQKALKCNLQCATSITENGFLKLNLSGPKRQFVKYYLLTLLKCESKIRGIKRLLSIICT